MSGAGEASQAIGTYLSMLNSSSSQAIGTYLSMLNSSSI